MSKDLNLQDMSEDLKLQISNAFNDSGAYWKLRNVIWNQNSILKWDEVEELIDRLEAFVVQEIQVIVDERKPSKS